MNILFKLYEAAGGAAAEYQPDKVSLPVATNAGNRLSHFWCLVFDPRRTSSFLSTQHDLRLGTIRAGSDPAGAFSVRILSPARFGGAIGDTIEAALVRACQDNCNLTRGGQ